MEFEKQRWLFEIRLNSFITNTNKIDMKQKFICALLGLFIFCGLTINAQEFRFGLLAGIDVTNIRLTNNDDVQGVSTLYDPMLSFNLNGYAGYKSAGFLGVSLEPGLIRKGGVMKLDKDSKDDDIRTQLYYIQMPILVDMYLCDKLFLSLGTELAYMIDAISKSKDASSNISEAYDNEFEVSGVFGINYSINDQVDIGIRYSHGFSYTLEISWTDSEGNILGKSEFYNQYGQLIIRFKI